MGSILLYPSNPQQVINCTTGARRRCQGLFVILTLHKESLNPLNPKPFDSIRKGIALGFVTSSSKASCLWGFGLGVHLEGQGTV